MTVPRHGGNHPVLYPHVCRAGLHDAPVAPAPCLPQHGNHYPDPAGFALWRAGLHDAPAALRRHTAHLRVGPALALRAVRAALHARGRRQRARRPGDAQLRVLRRSAGAIAASVDTGSARPALRRVQQPRQTCSRGAQTTWWVCTAGKDSLHAAACGSPFSRAWASSMTKGHWLDHATLEHLRLRVHCALGWGSCFVCSQNLCFGPAWGGSKSYFVSVSVLCACMLF